MTKYIFTDVVDVTEVSVDGETQYRVTYSDGRKQRVTKEVLESRFFPLETGETLTENDVKGFIDQFSVVGLTSETALASAFLKNGNTVYALVPLEADSSEGAMEAKGKNLIYGRVRSFLDGVLRWGRDGIRPFPDDPSDNEKEKEEHGDERSN